MTAPDREALRALCDAATPGPWVPYWMPTDGEVEHFGEAVRLSLEYDPDADRSYRLATDQSDPGWFNLGFMGNGPTSEANCSFIAAARSAVPELLDALDATEAELTVLRHQVAEARRVIAERRNAAAAHEMTYSRPEARIESRGQKYAYTHVLALLDEVTSV